MVVRLTMGGRSLTEEEVLFRHQLRKLIQREKVKRSLHRSFTPGRLFGGSETLNRSLAGSEPQVQSNPLYDSGSSFVHVSSAAVPTKETKKAAGLEGKGGNSNSCAGRSSRSLLQLMKQSHGSLKQLLSKENMAEDGASEGKEEATGAENRKRAKKQNTDGEEASLVCEELQSVGGISGCPGSRQVSADDTRASKPVLKPVKLSRGSSPHKSGKVSPVSITLPCAATDLTENSVELVKQQVGADVSLQNSPKTGSGRRSCSSHSWGNLQNSPRTGSGRSPLSLYSEENLQKTSLAFVDITLKDGIVPGKGRKLSARDAESTGEQDGSLSFKTEAISKEQGSFTQSVSADSCCPTEEKDSPSSGRENKRQSKTGCSASSTPSEPGSSELPSRDGSGRDTGEPLSHQLVHAVTAPELESGHPDAAPTMASRHDGDTDTNVGVASERQSRRPFRKLLANTIMCRCDADSIR